MSSCVELKYVNTDDLTASTARDTTEQYILCSQLLLTAYGCLLLIFSLVSILFGGRQVYLEDAAWSLNGSRTAAMGRSRMWIEGHLRLSASGGPTNSVTSGSRLAHPRFLVTVYLLWKRLRSLEGLFAQGAHSKAAKRRGLAPAGGGLPHFR